MTCPYEIAAIILAGGEGKRVGGANKGLLKIKGKTFVEHILSKFEGNLKQIIISANRDIETFQKLGFSVFPDQAEWKGSGPLAGLLSCWEHVSPSVDALLVVPCDTPFLPDDLIKRLYLKLFENPANQIVYARTSECVHPSIFLSKPEINENLQDHLTQGNRSLKSWIFRHQAEEVFFDDNQSFANINDMKTLTRYG